MSCTKLWFSRAMERQGFTSAQLKGSYCCRPKEEGAGAEEHSCGALDPSLGQAISCPSLLQLRLRILVERPGNCPLQTCLQKRTLPLMLPGQLSGRPGLRSRCQWGLLNHQKLALRKQLREDMSVEPNYAFAKGDERFGTRNMSSRYMLTRVPVLSSVTTTAMDVPSVQIARLTNMASSSSRVFLSHQTSSTPPHGGSSRAVFSRSLRIQLPPPSNLNSLKRWAVALATPLLVV